jgi:hypothetical protein
MPLLVSSSFRIWSLVQYPNWCHRRTMKLDISGFHFFFYCEGPLKCIRERNFWMHFTWSHQYPEESHMQPLFGYLSQRRINLKTYTAIRNTSGCAWKDIIPPSAMLIYGQDSPLYLLFYFHEQEKAKCTDMALYFTRNEYKQINGKSNIFF